MSRPFRTFCASPGGLRPLVAHRRMRGVKGKGCTHHGWIKPAPPERAHDLEGWFKEIKEPYVE